MRFSGVHSSHGTLYQTQVFVAPHGEIDIRSPQGHAGNSITTWCDRPVLLPFSIRLGIKGVNPVYDNTIKVNITISPA